ncbi:type II restriction endonuclease [Denitratisoma oestradiolicum]|uniref:Type II restriction endonuclease n=1 Tax=Denitratisoma oestradiolicum TaxID=311182 RepID=A0A6S6XSB4_9PROT|nr:type II restriction endonuclease [Denitratisoma oestradiolicum]TWO81965.1 type II restriction endonuclease [Denitratisoma oestradiolicum]CAB1368871.1 Type II restriction endonuclease [Denitratisoma oestradiolicum]
MNSIATLIQRWKVDPHSTYATWFLWEERLKNFRSIRRGISQVIQDIEQGSFGNAYRGSSLETVVGSVAEQRQIFKGADHAFLWKPKLRIPDIYENQDNQRAFARLLHICNCCDNEAQIIQAITHIDGLNIKGLGPAVANLLYFIHPTLVTPFNTAIVNGYNALTGSKVKLGRWDHYLAMRDGILALNQQHRQLLSNDLGAVAGLLFDVGSGRYPVPPLDGDKQAEDAWHADLLRVREEAASLRKAVKSAKDSDETHTQIQGWLRDLGKALGFAVWVASNDRGRPYGDSRLGDGCLTALPDGLATLPGAEAVRLIDVIWLQDERAVAAFEVEHTTSIYSGIVRLLDLAYGSELKTCDALFLVAPDEREADVRQQIKRPAFSRIGDLGIQYLPYGELRNQRDAIARFGSGLKPILAIAKALN